MYASFIYVSSRRTEDTRVRARDISFTAVRDKGANQRYRNIVLFHLNRGHPPPPFRPTRNSSKVTSRRITGKTSSRSINIIRMRSLRSKLRI